MNSIAIRNKEKGGKMAAFNLIDDGSDMKSWKLKDLYDPRQS